VPRITMPYLAGAPLSEISARRQAEAYQKAFLSEGVKDVKADLVPVATAEQTKVAVVSYGALAALPPEDCRRMIGYNGADTRTSMNRYAMGCEMKTTMSKMIAQPGDLLGRGGIAPDDSSRQGVIVQDYKDGVQNEKLDGAQASQVGGGG
jgi:type IV pilus biogenesis protein CpaD/CtpE